MSRAKAGSSTSAKQREGLPSDSSRLVAPQKSERYPPRYGAQHRQDALWEGGNEALPPGWTEHKAAGDNQPSYRDEALFMYAAHRPLPGVRLDQSWELITGCEWHISPLGRSYFVNHNTRTTSWKKPRPERPAGSLMPECIIKCGSTWYNDSLAFLGSSTSGDILSVSDDAICQWTRAGKPVGKPFDIEGEFVYRIAVSLDGLMAAGACGDGRVRLWNIKEGSLVGPPLEGNINDRVGCLDWSPNGAELAGGSEDGTIRRWNTSTGRHVGPLIKKSNGRIWTIKYSPQCDKFASGGSDDIISVWSKDGKLLIEIKGHEDGVTSLCWSKDGEYIFSSSYDFTIRKWQSIDGKELVVIRGQTNPVTSLRLSPDESHLVSASFDYSVRIWDLKTNQQVGDPLWHDGRVDVVAMSSDGQYIASAIPGRHAKIYVWSLDAALKHMSADGPSKAELKGRPVRSRDAVTILHTSQVSKQQPTHRPGGLTKYGKDFWDADTNTEPRSTAFPARPSFAHRWRDILRFSTGPNAPQSTPLEPRRWNFNLSRGSSPIRTVEVAAGRKKKRIYVSPPSAAEVARAEELARAKAAAAAQHANGNQSGSSTQVGQPQVVSGTQVSQGPTETQGAGGATGDVSYEGASCWAFFSAFFFGRRRPISRQS
ncbi:hypothetical protein CY34DRAFT_812266 [Suillus luteus UH-Slu-Lm8-n1]|uniref:WW domain-containing protein n=1 Tax=Suillus luteus UH-Slu-Lm8-n1 TaxID=930992 RepID=A0A0D0ATL4_9AGAM|nr:hypothetical protein CY34DRAFT_812266 [Suillus luteus UH-Slu-Lm8-n1]